jgi:hypothetical protein
MNIMKTPWRFLADLVSRKPAVEHPEKADENTSIIALEYRRFNTRRPPHLAIGQTLRAALVQIR